MVLLPSYSIVRQTELRVGAVAPWVARRQRESTACDDVHLEGGADGHTFVIEEGLEDGFMIGR